MRKKTIQRIAQLAKEFKDKNLGTKLIVETKKMQSNTNSASNKHQSSKIQTKEASETSKFVNQKEKHQQNQQKSIKDKLFSIRQTLSTQFINSQKWKLYQKEIAQKSHQISENLTSKSSELTSNLTHGLNQSYGKIKDIKNDISNKIADVQQSSKKNIEQIAQSLLKKAQQLQASQKKQYIQQQEVKKVLKSQDKEPMKDSQKIDIRKVGEGIINNISNKINVDIKDISKKAFQHGKQSLTNRIKKIISRYKWIIMMWILIGIFVNGLARQIPKQYRLYRRDQAELSLIKKQKNSSQTSENEQQQTTHSKQNKK